MNRSSLDNELSSLYDTLEYLDTFSEKYGINIDDDNDQAFNTDAPDFNTRLSHSFDVISLLSKGKTH